MDKIPVFLSKLVEHNSIETLSLDQVLSSFQRERILMESSRDIRSAVDPRNGEPVIYTPGRSLRPHDYQIQINAGRGEATACPICAGETTGILDWAALKKGITFINKNLYPVLPPPTPDIKENKSGPQGLHFVQWTSSEHKRDWFNMSLDDCTTVMGRLAVLEKALVNFSREIETRKEQAGSISKDSWCVSIIKNVGSAVGGSLEHGHQQVLLGNIVPRRILADQEFEARKGISFSQYLIRETPEKLVIKDYTGVVLMVAKFMRRPYEMILSVTDPDKLHLFDLRADEMRAVAEGWQDASRAIRTILPELRREVAFNVVAHNGPGSGLYFEFLPYTQEQGGLEQLGLAVCQKTPEQTADQIRGKLG